MEAWTQQNHEFQTSFSDFLTNTGGDSCFQMQISHADQHNLGEEPIGPLEVELGDMLPWSNILSQDVYDVPGELPTLHQWDFSAPQHMASMGDMQTYSSLFSEPALENVAGPSSQLLENPSSADQSCYNAFSTDLTSPEAFEQFLNFDQGYECGAPTAEIHSAEIPQAISYKPPSGAAHSSLRRVAASWNASFAITDPIDV